jgi:hypothetical protein
MAGSPDRPAAVAFVDFVDKDGGITQDAAIGWLRHEYSLSEGAAIPHFRRAWASGNVRGRTRRGWDYFEISEDGAIGRDGEPVEIPPYRCEVTGRLVHDLRLNADDLRWQIEQQLGKPPAREAPKRKPDNKPTQPKLDEALLNFAKARGQKVKQNDAEALAMLDDMGAAWHQKIKALQTLPNEYRYYRGKPAKSSA